MLLKVYSVYDSKTECYLQPFYTNSKGAAVRSFSEVANNPEHSIGKYPEDFTLFEVGSWDDGNCSFDLHKTPVSVGVAVEFVKTD